MNLTWFNSISYINKRIVTVVFWATGGIIDNHVGK